MKDCYSLALEDCNVKVYYGTSFLLSANSIKFFIDTEKTFVGEEGLATISSHYSLDWVIQDIVEIAIDKAEELGVTDDEGIKISECTLIIYDSIEESYLTVNSTNLILNKNLMSNVIFGNTEKTLDVYKLRPIEDKTLKELTTAFS